MPATLDDIFQKIEAQDKTIAEHGQKLATVVESQGAIAKAIDKPVYPKGTEPNPAPVVPAEPIDKEADGRFHMKSFGEFLCEVRRAPNKNTPTPALQKAYDWAIQKAIVGANETVGSEGGFLVPPEFSNKLFARVYGDSALLSRTDNYTVTGNSMVFPRSNETSRVTGSRWGGLQVYWVAEGEAGTVKKPGFGRLTLRLHKLMALSAMTEELLSDQAVMPQYMLRAVSDELDFMISDAIVRGDGVDKPFGILTSAARVTVAKEVGQVAATINSTNVVKMFARVFAGCRKNMVWLYNQDIEPQLFTMTIGTAGAQLAVYLPPGGLSSSPYGTLMGRPMIPIEQAETLGTEGDLILTDLSQYVTIGKGGPMSAQSMHFYFDTDQQAFRVTVRIDGQPWWATSLTPYKGTNKQSCIVTLETRA